MNVVRRANYNRIKVLGHLFQHYPPAAELLRARVSSSDLGCQRESSRQLSPRAPIDIAYGNNVLSRKLLQIHRAIVSDSDETDIGLIGWRKYFPRPRST